MSGPFTKSIQRADYRVNSSWYRQPRPRVKPLPYSMTNATREWGTYWNMTTAFQSSYYGSPQSARNKAYDKLVNLLGDRTQGWVDLAERRKLAVQLAMPLEHLVRGVRQIKHFEFSAAARTFGISRPSGLKNKSKSFGSNFLAYHLGWEQNIKEVGTLVKIFDGDFPPVDLRASARIPPRSLDWSSENYYSRTSDIVTYSCGAVMGARLSLTNPDLFLLNRLGFVNPVGVAWELVPFSFVVDWFVNVGSFIASKTDFIGTQLIDPYTTTFERSTRNTRFSNKAGYNYIQPGTGGGYNTVTVQRSLGISGPVLAVKPLRGPSLVRAATAISLLLNFLK